jgi:DNA repair exonuclease SbcCD ATPase subunit
MAPAKGKGAEKGSTGARSAGGDVDALFQLPLSEFTGARNAQAARLKKAGHPEQADEVKSLAKPPVSAWAVNQLYWRHRDAFDRLMTTGEQFRKAQAAQLSGKSADLRGPLEARRSALSDLSRMAASLLREAGNNPTPDTMRRIMTTLEAMSSYGDIEGGPRAGRLTDDVDPVGFETLAALIPSVGGGKAGTEPTRIIQFRQQQKERPSRRKTTKEEDERRAEEERKERLAAARAALQEAEKELKASRKTAHEAEEKLKKAAAQAKEAEKVKADAEKALETAAAEADTARQQARRVAVEAEDAAQALEDAERALEKAARELKDLS